jgi:hypothetical protein
MKWGRGSKSSPVRCLLTTDFGPTRCSPRLVVRPPRRTVWPPGQLIMGRFRSSWILSLNPLFHKEHDSNSGRLPEAYIMKVPWSIEAIPIASTKILLIGSCFYLFCPNSSKTEFCSLSVLTAAWDILGGLADLEQPLCELLLTGSPPPEERSRRPTRVHTWHRPRQSDHHCTWSAMFCSAMDWPPAPRIEALGPILGPHRHVHVTAVKLSTSTHFLTTLLGRISS